MRRENLMREKERIEGRERMRERRENEPLKKAHKGMRFSKICSPTSHKGLRFFKNASLHKGRVAF